MREQTASHFVGLDIGTSEVRVIVGMMDGEDAPSLCVIGHGSAPNLGMRKGIVTHLDDVAQAIGQAVDEAERISGIPIKQATVNINGIHVSGLDSKGVIAISSANREINEDDRFRVEEAATIVQLPPNREIIQVFAKNYRVDGLSNIKDPVGMRGVRLEVDTHIVTAASPSVRNLLMALDKTNIKPSHLTVASLAAAEAVLNRQQKEAGTLLLDIGAGTTNLVIVEDGEVQYVAVIPVGGIHITNDLAIGLKTDLDIAEKVKITQGALADKVKTGKISVDHEKKNHVFDADDLNMIIEARMEELLEIVDKELKKIHKSRKLPGGVVLVGGTANIPGIAEFAKEKLQLASRIGKLQDIGGLSDIVENPKYCTTVGLMMLDMLLGDNRPSSNNNSQGVKGVFGLISDLMAKIKH